jgi:hypothetical protein
MGSRLNLQTKLVALIGNNNVYFQPPPDFMLSYPCIVYSRVNIRSRFGDNVPYSITKEYNLTVIDTNPDSEIPDKVSKLERCAFDRHFTTSNLNHDVFNILF